MKLSVVVAALVAACILTPRLYEIKPLTEYAQWFREAETCIGVKSNFAEVRWMVDRSNDGTYFWCIAEGGCAGVWSPPNRITIASRYLRTPSLVKHEMLHHILKPGNHNDTAFVRCAEEPPK